MEPAGWLAERHLETEGDGDRERHHHLALPVGEPAAGWTFSHTLLESFDAHLNGAVAHRPLDSALEDLKFLN